MSDKIVKELAKESKNIYVRNHRIIANVSKVDLTIKIKRVITMFFTDYYKE